MLAGMLIFVPEWYRGISLLSLTSLIQIIGLACFAYIVVKRFAPLADGERDFRFDRPWLRLQRVLKYWFGQWKHPRYRIAGTLHLLIFAGFLILATRAFYLLLSDCRMTSTAAGAIGTSLRRNRRLCGDNRISCGVCGCDSARRI